jgi:protein N-terminal asparagine amidohydrolase
MQLPLVALQVVYSSGGKRSKQEGYSHPLCCKIVEVLHKSEQQFNLQSFCVLGNNTKTDSYGNARPVVGGFVVSDFLTSESTKALICSF